MIDREIPRLKRRLAQRRAGAFHFRDLVAEWDSLPIGEKVRRGHAFLTAVRAGKLPGVTDSGEKDSAGRLYHWRGA